MRYGIAALAALCVVAGCSRTGHQSVQWFIDHPSDREAKLKWCGDDAARAVDVDCLNASKANEQALLHGGPPTASSFKFNAGAASARQPQPQQKGAADSFTFDPSRAASQGGM